MYLLDEYIKSKFLEEISIIFKQYNIENKTYNNIYTPTGNLLTRILENKFCAKFFKIYIKHYKRNFTILEVLAAKQNLDTQRQVFRIVKENININNTTLTISHLLNLYYSHTNNTVIQTSEKLAQSGVKINITQSKIKITIGNTVL